MVGRLLLVLHGHFEVERLRAVVKADAQHSALLAVADAQHKVATAVDGWTGNPPPTTQRAE